MECLSLILVGTYEDSKNLIERFSIIFMLQNNMIITYLHVKINKLNVRTIS